MLDFPGVSVITQSYESNNSQVDHATTDQDKQPIIIKCKRIAERYLFPTPLSAHPIDNIS